ncbi:MAG: CRISPR-associated protein Csx15 [Bacillota bacterium]
MRVLNFTHPLTDENLEEIKALAGCAIAEVIEVPSQIDLKEPLDRQIEELVEGVGLTARQWQTEPVVVNLPSLNYSAAVLLAQLHGRMGHFPPVLRLRPVHGGLIPRFEVAEILNLQAARERARGKR